MDDESCLEHEHPTICMHAIRAAAEPLRYALLRLRAQKPEVCRRHVGKGRRARERMVTDGRDTEIPSSPRLGCEAGQLLLPHARRVGRQEAVKHVGQPWCRRVPERVRVQ